MAPRVSDKKGHPGTRFDPKGTAGSWGPIGYPAEREAPTDPRA
jgi:hypothetical protein